MLCAKVEPYADVAEELRALYPLEWAEAGLDRDRPEARLEVDFDRYTAMDQAGLIVAITLREDSRLVGYFTAFVTPALHFRACLTAYHDLFYVLPEFRGRQGGVRLLREARRELIRRGVHRWIVGSTVAKPADRLYEALGFEPAETYYSMWLGDSPKP